MSWCGWIQVTCPPCRARAGRRLAAGTAAACACLPRRTRHARPLSGRLRNAPGPRPMSIDSDQRHTSGPPADSLLPASLLRYRPWARSGIGRHYDPLGPPGHHETCQARPRQQPLAVSCIFNIVIVLFRVPPGPARLRGPEGRDSS